MKFTKFLVLILLAVSVLSAQTGTQRGRVLGFYEGDNEFAFGFLAGYNEGGFGVPLIWDRAAFGGMFSFGAEARMWWDRYYRNLWGYTHNGNFLTSRTEYDPNNGAWLFDEWGYFANGNWNPVWRNTPSGQFWVGNSGQLNRYDNSFTMFGISPAFRFGYHPFGMPSLRGQVKAAKHIDPYVGLKIGFSLFFYDKDDPFYRNDRTEFDLVLINPMTGIRWYFKENVSLWAEFARWDFSLGFAFKF